MNQCFEWLLTARSVASARLSQFVTVVSHLNRAVRTGIEKVH